MIYKGYTYVINLLIKYSPINSQFTIFSIGNVIAELLLLAVPYYNNLMFRLSISPLAGYGILCILGFISLFFLKKSD